jgi:predicted outer membrane protein
MINDHVKDISEFERALAQATNADIKQFVSEALPVLKDHLKMARELAGKLGKTG